jgi:hypothetical protein
LLLGLLLCCLVQLQPLLLLLLLLQCNAAHNGAHLLLGLLLCQKSHTAHSHALSPWLLLLLLSLLCPSSTSRRYSPSAQMGKMFLQAVQSNKGMQ